MARAANRRPWLTVGFVAATGTVLFYSGLIWYRAYLDRPFNSIRVEQVAVDLPVGSTWEQAEAWLASHGFNADQMIDDDDRVLGLRATTRNDSPGGCYDIDILLHFGPDRRLREREIHRSRHRFAYD